jgi:hypothetical protein
MAHGMSQSRIIRSLRFGKHRAAAWQQSRLQLLAACRRHVTSRCVMIQIWDQIQHAYEILVQSPESQLCCLSPTAGRIIDHSAKTRGSVEQAVPRCWW